MLNEEQVNLVGRILFKQPEDIIFQALLCMERGDWHGILDLTCGAMDPDTASRVITASLLADYHKTFEALTLLFTGGMRPKNMIACGLAGTILGFFQGTRQFHRLQPGLIQRFETRSIRVVGEMVASTESFMLGFAETISKNDMNSIDGAVKAWARDDVKCCQQLARFLQSVQSLTEERGGFSNFGNALLGSMAFGAMADWDSMKLFSAVASPTVDSVRIEADLQHAEAVADAERLGLNANCKNE